MVFEIQQSQNKYTKALHLKLNELIACNQEASDRFIDIEDLTSEEIEVLKYYYVELSELPAKEKEIFSSPSVDEAKKGNAKKLRAIR